MSEENRKNEQPDTKNQKETKSVNILKVTEVRI